jgi:hypothetical protein
MHTCPMFVMHIATTLPIYAHNNNCVLLLLPLQTHTQTRMYI